MSTPPDDPGRSGCPAATPRRSTDTDTALPTLTRREAIERVVRLLGGAALVGGEALLSASVGMPERAAAAEGIGEFSAADVALLDEIAETILPETSTPGAKAAQTGAFIALMATEAYDPQKRRILRAGMRAIERACRRMHGVAFVDATPAQRLAVLEPLDREQHAETEGKRRRRRPHYFRMVKELTLLGYFTSEIGYLQAMRYVETPGRFDPCVPYRDGETIWAPHA